VESFRAPATADGVPRRAHLQHYSRALHSCFSSAREAGLIYVLCVRSAAQRSLVRLAPIRPHLRWELRSSLTPGLGSYPPTSDQVHPPPTSASGLSRSLAHLCTAKESVPRPHLHRNRLRPSPTSAPPLLPSGTSAFAQHRCGAVQCVATARAVLQHSATWARTIPFCGSIFIDRNSPEDAAPNKPG
jgi:hypothetical protein